MNLAIISVGSNIEPLENIVQAAKSLAEIGWLVSVSAFQRTKPEGMTDQPDFLNGAFYIRTPLNQADLESRLKKMESSQGRVRTSNKDSPRTIDLDIVAFNGEIIDSDYYRYPFVKEAVDEIISQIRSKQWKKTVRVV